eukprot:gene33651-41517_t
MVNAAVVIFGPQGCGKTRNASALAKHYGKSVVYDYDEAPSARRIQSLPAEALVLTNVDVRGAIPFATAMVIEMNNTDTANTLAECAGRALSRFPGTSRAQTDDRTFYFTSLLAYAMCNAGDPIGAKLLDLVELSSHPRAIPGNSAPTKELLEQEAGRECTVLDLQAALNAAAEFKLLLDAQPPGRLLNPGGRCDARDSAHYKAAAKLLRELTPERFHSGDGPTLMLSLVFPIAQLEIDHHANAVPHPLDVLQQVKRLLLSFGIKEVDQHGSSSEDRRLFEFRHSGIRERDQGRKPLDGEVGAVHCGPSAKLMNAFRVTVRTLFQTIAYSAIGPDSAAVHLAALTFFGACGVTVTPITRTKHDHECPRLGA